MLLSSWDITRSGSEWGWHRKALELHFLNYWTSEEVFPRGRVTMVHVYKSVVWTCINQVGKTLWVHFTCCQQVAVEHQQFAWFGKYKEENRACCSLGPHVFCRQRQSGSQLDIRPRFSLEVHCSLAVWPWAISFTPPSFNSLHHKVEIMVSITVDWCGNEETFSGCYNYIWIMIIGSVIFELW